MLPGMHDVIRARAANQPFTWKDRDVYEEIVAMVLMVFFVRAARTL